MNIYYSPEHLLHSPTFEIFEDGQHVNYFETPDRIEAILLALREFENLQVLKANPAEQTDLLRVHSAEYLNFLENIYVEWLADGAEAGNRASALYPTAQPLTKGVVPSSISGKLGYFVKDLSAPILPHTYQAAKASAGCAVSAAQQLLNGANRSAALCRPPGHHAGIASSAGYCYLNNAAIAAAKLAEHQRVAILDIDYHAGNGTQEIFYNSDQVLTLSIHADPSYEYPYFNGFASETGAGVGKGYHHNFTLARGTKSAAYFDAAQRALQMVSHFQPQFLLVSAGFDTYQSDPLGTFKLDTPAYNKIGNLIAGCGLPVQVVLEGGYDIVNLGNNFVALLEGLGE